MTECSQSGFEFASHFSRRVTARFDGGAITSDGGLLLLREVERRIACSLGWQPASKTVAARIGSNTA